MLYKSVEFSQAPVPAFHANFSVTQSIENTALAKLRTVAKSAEHYT